MRLSTTALAAALATALALAIAAPVLAQAPEPDAAAVGPETIPDLDEGIVRILLTAEGFETVGDLAKEDGAYTGTATRDGEEVAVRVDAKTGEVSTGSD